MTDLTYQLLVDTDDDGGYATDEVADGNVLADTAVTASRGHGFIKALTPAQAGSFYANLRSAALADLSHGRLVRFTATKGVTTRSLFTGISQESEQARYRLSPSIGLSAIGTFNRLAGKKVSTQLYENITVDQAIGYCLDAVGWPALERDIDVSDAVLLLWSMDEADVFDELNSLKATDGPLASLYEDGDGYAVFKNHQARFLDARSVSAQETFYSATTLPSIHDLTLSDPLKNIVNVASIPTRLREVAGSLSVIWTQSDSVTLAAGETYTISVRPDGTEPFKEAVTPVAGTDYTLVSGSVTPTLSRTSGYSTDLTFTAGGSGAVLSGLQVRAKLFTTTSKSFARNTLDMSASIASHGRRNLPENILIKEDLGFLYAQDLANAFVSIYGEGRERAVMIAKNDSTEAEDALMDLDIGDRIRLVDAVEYGIDQDYYIEAIAYEVTGAGLLVAMTFSLELASGSGYWILDTDELDGAVGIGF